MIEFKQVEVSDKEWVEELLRYSDFYGCEYAFGNTYMWSRIFNIKIANHNGFYVVKNRYGYLYPVGSGSVGQLQELIELLKEDSSPLCFTNANGESVDLLKQLYGDQRLKISTNRDYYDYVYDYTSLATLKGKKLHSKRNHLNRFYENNWTFEPIIPDNIEECADMHNKWCEEKEIYLDKEKLQEANAITLGLERFFELGFIGGIIRVDGEIHGYTFGEPIISKHNDTFVVHAEKAFSKVQGTYTAINHQFVNSLSDNGYKFINREEDMGAEGLRKAKMSYCPAFMVEKYRVGLE